MKTLEIKNISKIYGSGENQVRAIDGVDLVIENGEFISIVGSSGSGKTTLLNILASLDKPTSGHVILNGRNFAEVKQRGTEVELVTKTEKNREETKEIAKTKKTNEKENVPKNKENKHY